MTTFPRWYPPNHHASAMLSWTITRRLATALLIVICFGSWPAARAAEIENRTPEVTSPGVPALIHSIVQQSCVDCHQGEQAEAGLDLEGLSSNLDDPETLRHWVRVVDRVRDGEMPPEDYGSLETEASNQFVEQASTWIQRWQREEQRRVGRVRSRRLTKLQLERTLHDLLAIDRPLASLIPDEPRTEGFAGIADRQSISHFRIESHLRMVDAALDAAFERVTDSAGEPEKRFTARDIARSDPKRRCRDPEMLDGLAVTWSSRLIFYGRISSSTVPESGWYRITLTASALNSPEDHGVWCTVRTGKCTSGAPLLSWVGAFEATEQPKQVSYDAWIPRGHMLEIRPGDTTLKMARFRGGQVGAGEGTPQNVPGVALHEMSMERIHPGGDLEAVRDCLFGELDIEIDRQQDVVRLPSDDPLADTTKQLRVFAERAFRRPVDDSTLQPYREMLADMIAAGSDPISALRGAYRAVLCSPRFLYFTEAPGELDDFAIASRLSYLLTGSMPDETLRKLAAAGRLRDKSVIAEQTERLLRGSRQRQFIEDFTAQWLDLVDIDFTEPDRRLYPDFDIVVQNAMLSETRHFLEFLIDNDRPATEMIDADFTFLNSRLARYYGIEGVPSDQIERVSLDVDSPRGGLLGHGSILKVTANGTNTSPVLRGVWVSERLLGQPIPPPPANVPAIEPDVRGATTIREMLAKHRSDVACASCHQKIDPPGFALENFDPAGHWRESYRQGRTRVPIDASYVMADGREFDGFEDFRALVASTPKPLAQNFAEKLLTYGTGAKISFADRELIDQIVEQTEDKQYGLRSLIHAVVTSPIFLTK